MRNRPTDALLRAAYDPEAGHWRSRLSPSALAAATAATACRTALTAPGASVRSEPALAARCTAAATSACTWLVDHQNTDGGWGDTPDSPSNLPASLLAWSTLAAHQTASGPIARASTWLAAPCGGTPSPDRLVDAVTSTYGADRTFAVPILMMLTLNGALGPSPAAWRKVAQLPCELAVLPHGLFRFLRLGVVSYALPALIAVGLCRHRHAPSRTPATWLRNALTPRLLRRLHALQPPHGGFLEAVPLSAFVAMSLSSAGFADHPVTRRALEFVLAAARPNGGGWPIDTNLDTWVTSLAVTALGTRARIAACLDDPQAPDAILRHLLASQGRSVHPYTQARPGGWAWTALPGAVPDADDTAGALVALSRLCPAGHPMEPHAVSAATRGLFWLAQLQNTDGGIPTFCRGWGRLPFDRSASDLTAHVLEALQAWLPRLPAQEAERMHRVRRRAIRFLLRTQAADGSWQPLWFGSQAVPGGGNPVFGTARVVRALREEGRSVDVSTACDRALAYLHARQHPDGSWGRNLGTGTGTAEETGLVLCALPPDDPARPRAEAWARAALDAGLRPSPLGLYFARLWYSEALYPVIWLAAAGL